MRSAALFLLSGFVLAGCGTARNVAVTTFRVIDAPAAYVRDRIDRTETQTTTTSTMTYGAGAADHVVSPGHPVSPRPPVTTRSPAGSRTTRSSTADTRPRSSPPATPRPAATQQFPIAKPVPGKPGYVYSIDPNGGIVDVTGYKPGDKAKDPYTKQIFIVP